MRSPARAAGPHRPNGVVRVTLLVSADTETADAWLFMLPTDWLTTLRALEASNWAREAFGSEFLGVYLAVKRAEYRQFMGEVGEQDWRWYLHQA